MKNLVPLRPANVSGRNSQRMAEPPMWSAAFGTGEGSFLQAELVGCVSRALR